MTLRRTVLGAVVCVALSASAGVPRTWQARWIAYPYERQMGNFDAPVLPAPVFRRSFELKEPVAQSRLFVSGLGFFTCTLDGRRVSDARLVPAPTTYDRRWRYRRFEIGPIAAGRHVLSIEVGDGFYRASTPNYWHFEHAPWTDYPKAICELENAADGRVILATDERWSCAFGPVVRTELRGGERFDARLELPPFETEGPRWKAARLVPGPGGIAEEEVFPPCRVTAIHPMTREPGTSRWRAAANLVGVPRLTVRGEAGAEIELSCGEEHPYELPDGTRTNALEYAREQRDVYVLKGAAEGETWSPEYTYHGFQSVEVVVRGRAEILDLALAEVHTDFPSVGSVRTSNETLMRLHAAAVRSACGNFVGVPTDCPHREKNGWTSEARLQCEALLYSFDAASAYAGFVNDMLDAQRPNGQLPGMLPTGGVGYNWGSGPAWDAALALIPESLYRFTGSRESVAQAYPGVRRWSDFAETLRGRDGLIQFGLGDWCCAAEPVSPAFVNTAFAARVASVAARFARLLGRPTDEAAALEARADDLAASLCRAFYRGKGVFASKSSTAAALALEFELVPASERAAVTAELVRLVKANRARVDYGTIGSGCVLRALFEAGEADLAFEVMTQEESPGYAHWVTRRGLTTFPENWKGDGSSLNHGAFVDFDACLFRYLGGFRHTWERPGRSFLVLRPHFPSKLSDFAAEHDGWRFAWRRSGACVTGDVVVPSGATARLELPGVPARELTSGTHHFEVSFEDLTVNKKGK